MESIFIMEDIVNELSSEEIYTINHQEFINKYAREPNRKIAIAEVKRLSETLINRTGKGLNLVEANLNNLDLRHFDLRRANLNRAQLYNTDLSFANLSEASLVCAGTERTKFKGAILQNSYLHALAAQVSDFEDADLSHVVDGTGALFHGCKMSRAKLTGSVLSGTYFYQCDLTSAKFDNASMQGGIINECMLDKASFNGTELSQFSFTKCSANELSLKNAMGEGVVIQRLTSCDQLNLCSSFFPSLRLSSLRAKQIYGNKLQAPCSHIHNCVFSDANFSESNFSLSNWSNSSIVNADLSYSKLNEASFLYIVADGANFKNAKAENFRAVESIFSNCNFENFSGRTLVMRDCSLKGANMRNAYLYRSMLTGDPPKAMNMQGVILEDANLVQAYIAADLSGASLENANCVYSRLNQSQLDETNLVGVNLYGSSLIKTSFINARINAIKGPFFLDRCAGLLDAIEATDDFHNEDLKNYVKEFMSVFRKSNHGST